MKRLSRRFFLPALLMAALAVPVGAVPIVLSHQGRLLDTAGRPLSGSHDITLELFDAPDRGRLLYGQSQRLNLVDGLYTFDLGENDPAPDDLKDALASGEVWLQVTVDRVALAPREKVKSVPYAIRAATVVNGAIGTPQLAANAVDSSRIEDGSVGEEDLEPGLLDRTDPLRQSHEAVFAQLAPLMDGEALPAERLKEIACFPDANMRLSIQGFTHSRVVGFRVTEGISEMMRAEVLFESGLGTLPVEHWLNKDAELLWERSGRVRRFSGIVTQSARLGAGPAFSRFAVVIEPHQVRLRYNQGFDLYQQQSVSDVVDNLLNKAGISGPEVLASPPERHSIFQHNESDLQFLSRLLEEEGIWYILGDETPMPSLVLGDANAQFPAGITLNHYGPLADSPLAGEEYLCTFNQGGAVFPGIYNVRSYQDPSGQIVVGSADLGDGIGAVHTLQGPLISNADADIRAQRGAQADFHRFHNLGGFSNAGQLKAGRMLQVNDTAGQASGAYMVNRVVHTGIRVGGAPECFYYANRFEVKLTDQPYRPPRITPVPRSPGIQTATVVGPAGEQIHVDEHGRIKVKFHWDRSGASDETVSGWIPLMRPSHGANQSAFFIPEIGDEVVVGFLSGDPDRPVVLGSVPNAQAPPRYPLPGEKNRSYLFNQSGSNAINEIRMDRTAGSEELFLTSPNFRVSAPNLELAAERGLLDINDELEMLAGGDIALVAGKDLDLDAGALLRLSAPTVEVAGPLRLRTSLGNNGVYAAGRAYGDNQLVAWARVNSGGTLGESHFGIASLSRDGTGVYEIDIDAPFGLQGVVPIAVAERDSPPGNSATLRIVSVDQAGPGTFKVYVNNGDGLPVDNDFVFMVTGR